jgi:TolA-binding protein
MFDLDRPLKTRLREPVLPVDALWRAIERRRRRSAARRPYLVALGPALSALLLLLALRLHGAKPPTPLTLANGRALNVLQSDSHARAWTLSDGSRVELAPDTKLVPRWSNATSLGVELVHGRALFDVVPHGPRRWLVLATDVRVSVLGTRFGVEQQDGLRVRVERGLVEVTGPRVPHGAQRLAAGQSLFVPSANLTTAPAGEPSPLSPSAGLATAPPTAAVGSRDSSAPARGEAAPAPHATSSDTSAALRAAAVEALLAQADAARSSGHPERAVRAFDRVVKRYPNDPRAALAAFTLAHMYLEQLARPSAAAAAFERASALGLPRALAEECAALTVEAYARAHQGERARAAAQAYRQRFPEGVRRSAVEASARSR